MNWNEEKVIAFRKSLIDWYETNKRILPWRENTEAYRIWVSEIMLQQTKVDTVMPYFDRFMEWFPTMKDFADAPEERILKAWEGLGYYSRVRNLQAAMKTVVYEMNGIVPNDLEGILALKGVGPYTAGAVLSIAYEKAEPAVDGNVMRVISRVLEIDEDIMKQKTRKTFEKALYTLIDPDKPGEFNQGLMEIGALVCTPKKPMCLICPLQSFCEAHQKGEEEKYPVKIKKTKVKKVFLSSVIVKQGEEQFIIEQRPDTGLLANLWQFPTVTKSDNQEALKLAFLQEYGIELQLEPEPITHVKHIFSHLVWEVDVFVAQTITTQPSDLKLKTVTKAEMEHLAFPVPYQKMWQAFQKGETM
ncbi:A/G-specific adenine glycosylase [Listeria booriae]|uniref:A/G-specific adenine glycosylase n=1 Tax=Listeria booriae TaxID=1552123 RepID=UPI001623B7EC|nr:A/G-specific adenine glycosylase [Listeria booriae]MBC1228403.1 A/G-specific adenine glycosylase [Listeria booriae]MBC2366857.1 A/G-specific adenine glycosylase [Listeria booriae]